MTALFSFLSRFSTSWEVSRKSSSLSASSGRSGPCSLHSMLWVRLFAAPLAAQCWLSAGGFLSPVHRGKGWATGWANPTAAAAAAAARQDSHFSFHREQAISKTNVLGNQTVLGFINPGSQFHKWKQILASLALPHGLVLMMDFAQGDLFPKPMGTRWMGEDKPAFVRGERTGFRQRPSETQESTSSKENYSFSSNS